MSISTIRCAACRAAGRRPSAALALPRTIPAPTCLSRLSERVGVEDDEAVAELSVRALCSNRHLPEHLPVGESGADFRLLDDVTLNIVCAAGPTRPREPVVAQRRSRSEVAYTGTVAWRLINMVSLNHLGLVERGAGKNGQSLEGNPVDVCRSVRQRRRAARFAVSAASTVSRWCGGCAGAAVPPLRAALRSPSPSRKRRSRAAAPFCWAPFSIAFSPNMLRSIPLRRP